MTSETRMAWAIWQKVPVGILRKYGERYPNEGFYATEYFLGTSMPVRIMLRRTRKEAQEFLDEEGLNISNHRRHWPRAGVVKVRVTVEVVG